MLEATPDEVVRDVVTAPANAGAYGRDVQLRADAGTVQAGRRDRARHRSRQNSIVSPGFMSWIFVDVLPIALMYSCGVPTRNGFVP